MLRYWGFCIPQKPEEYSTCCTAIIPKIGWLGTLGFLSDNHVARKIFLISDRINQSAISYLEMIPYLKRNLKFSDLFKQQPSYADVFSRQPNVELHYSVSKTVIFALYIKRSGYYSFNNIFRKTYTWLINISTNFIAGSILLSNWGRTYTRNAQVFHCVFITCQFKSSFTFQNDFKKL